MAHELVDALEHGAGEVAVAALLLETSPVFAARVVVAPAGPVLDLAVTYTHESLHNTLARLQLRLDWRSVPRLTFLRLYPANR